MCWWHKRRLKDDSDDAKETLLYPGKKEANKETRKENNIKQQKYHEVINKYKDISNPGNTTRNISFGSSEKPVIGSQSSNSSKMDNQDKKSLKLKSDSQGFKSLPVSHPPKVQRFENKSLDRVVENVSERGEKLEDIEEKTNELQEKSKHYRSASKKLKERQAQKLKKSVFTW